MLVMQAHNQPRQAGFILELTRCDFSGFYVISCCFSVCFLWLIWVYFKSISALDRPTLRLYIINHVFFLYILRVCIQKVIIFTCIMFKCLSSSTQVIFRSYQVQYCLNVVKCRGRSFHKYTASLRWRHTIVEVTWSHYCLQKTSFSLCTN